MTGTFLTLLAQIDPNKLSSEARLDVASSSVVPWLITGVITVGILLVTFKTSKRNATDRD